MDRVEKSLYDFRHGMKTMVRILRNDKTISKEEAARCLAQIEAAK